ncbi:MAG: 50S ribosomal protein L9 [Clostridia bacterium]|nr:50S ribosomal protein L9 [Clostridia bacterium]
MKVILLQDVKSQGKKDQVINVSDGYATNFLFPRKLAVPADAKALNEIKQKEAAKQHRIETEKAEAKALAEKLESILVKIQTNAGADGKLYGSVTAKDVSDALESEFNIQLDKRKIVIADSIRSFGSYELEAKLYQDISATIHLLVCQK